MIKNLAKNSMKSLALMLIAVTCYTPTLTHATTPKWNIIPGDSTISFTATQNNAPVMGQFKDFSGDIAFDPTQLNEITLILILI